MVSLIAWKTYVHETPYARLVPGEEADNGSVVHLDLSRDMAPNLTATPRSGHPAPHQGPACPEPH